MVSLARVTLHPLAPYHNATATHLSNAISVLASFVRLVSTQSSLHLSYSFFFHPFFPILGIGRVTMPPLRHQSISLPVYSYTHPRRTYSSFRKKNHFFFIFISEYIFVNVFLLHFCIFSIPCFWNLYIKAFLRNFLLY